MLNRALRLISLLAIVAIVDPTALAAGAGPGDGPWLQYSDARDAGFDPDELAAVRQAADDLGSGAFLVVRRGHVVVAWGDIERPFKCHSVRKSLLSALYGPAVSAGRIDLDAKLVDLGIDDVHGLTEAEKQATVEQLIQSRSGVYHPAAKEPREMKKNRPERGSVNPGERFWYNNWDFNTAGYVFEQATGRGIFEAFAADLAGPLGMDDFALENTLYQYERRSTRIPAYAFRLSARDAARFGLLYLLDGKWDGRRLVPADWIERSWEAHSDLGDHRGYGYMWWIYGPGTSSAHPEYAAYAASGTGGQLIAVIPALDLVVVHRADTDFGRGVGGSKVWGLVRDVVDAIDPDAKVRTKRTQPVVARSFSRTLPPLQFPRTVALAPEALDRYVGSYRMGPNVEVELTRIDDTLVGWMTGFGETDFAPIGENEFWSRATGASVKFELDAAGNVGRAVLRLRGQEMIAEPAR